MSKRKKADVIDPRLSGLGFDPALAPADAVAKLRGLHAAGAAPKAAIAAALGNLSVPESVQLLSEMETEASGADRREIRRAMFKLAQRGLKTAPRAATPAQPAAIAASAGLSALMSPIDPEGARLVWILKERAQGGVRRLWVLASEAEGLVGARLSNLSRHELRDERAELERRANLRLIDADWRLADFVICEAYNRTPESRRSQVGNFLMIRSEIIAGPPPTEFEHPVYAELAVEIAAEPSIDLLKEPELAGWRMPPAEIKPYLDEVNEVRQSPLVLGRLQNEERINAVAERAIGALMAGARAMLIRRRLEDTAYYLLRSGRRVQAGWAASAAARIRDGADPKRIAFFQTFVRAQLGEMLAQEQQREHEEPRLIMTPAEAMRARMQRSQR